ncbi:glycosyl hydrolase [Suilimivivens aceti]|uniref:Glycosyl hydrolase n=1 Tax=Suilimivivens aceti TaxID=2981774 RepID=A0ABT2T5Y0_9FIRM|nr:TIM-barrel domain-containing protein [Suilimivivens aceti]MCU6745317.1 glycosyl hydrolase [Suilimivivens aceti]SCI14880.1 Alpha-xylosidase [uncultured Clostridium sp.]
MIFEIIKGQGYQKRIPLGNGLYAQIRRTEAEKLVIDVPYQGVYGLGEKFDSVNQKGKTVETQVIEKFCNQGNISYCVTPFFITDSGFGIYIKTGKKTVISLQDEIICEIPKEAEVTVFTGSIGEIIQDYVGLFQKPKLPPRYAFGIWVSANHWNCEADVDRLLAELEEYRFPASVIVLEAWSDEATFYIWNGAEYKPEKSKEGFSYEDFDFRNSPYWKDPKGMIEKLHEKGKKLVLWQIPVFKGMEPDRTSEQLDLDKEYAIEHGLAVLNKDGTPYEIPEGNWFEGSYIPDFTNEKTREFWFRKRQYLTDIGVDGFKTDGGEFIYSKDVLFSDGTDGEEGKNQYCQDYINAYSHFITEDQVLFSRAGYAGASGTPILWAGDHQSTNDELKNVLRAALSSAMSGILFWSFDIGGFAGPLPSLDLYRRSTQMAVFTPVMQWHSEPDGGQFRELMPGAEGNNERSPWNIAMAYNKPEFIEEMRYWHMLRKALLPYIYESAQTAVRESRPMMRPLVFDYQADRAVTDIEDEYLFGDSLLVAPFMEEDQTSRKVYLPEGKWHDLFTGRCYEGKKWHESDRKSRLPVYIKADATIPVDHNGKTIMVKGG